MPFTVSHSAAVLPFLRSKHLSATGLIIGTMAPDFEYFFRMNVKGIYGHTIPGILYFDLPVSIMLAFLFHDIVKRNLIDQLPVFLQSRFTEVREFNFNEYIKSHKIVFILSAIIGTASHIIWDSFTHEKQFFVRALPQIYEGHVVPFLGVNYPLWYAMQYISTIVGGIIVIWYVFSMKRESGVYNRPLIGYWLLLILIIGLIVTIRMQFKIYNEPYVVKVITSCSAFCIGITILGFIRFKRREVSFERPTNK
jgi:hypothetical protein